MNNLIRTLKRGRRNRDSHYLVGIDQSFSNYAMVLFRDGIPIDRTVFHTGDPTTIKNSKKCEDKTESRFFVETVDQLAYLYDCVINRIALWNPDDIVMEGLSFGSISKVERQLGALYFGLQVSLMRELGYERGKLHTVTPHQCKALARTFLIADDQYERDEAGCVVYLKTKAKKPKPKLNPMKNKRDMIKALGNTPYEWLLDGYTRDGLVASRSKPTGIEDIPDAYFIGLCVLEDKFNHKENRITKR